jgi:DNA repair protein RecO (recombination protein O)
MFTELFGLQSYIVNGVRSKSSKNKIAHYQPLSLLNLVVYHREQANIERIKEIQCYHPYATLATDIRKSTVGLFIAEILNRTVKDESHAQELFEFISNALITFDTMPSNFENFHLVFLIKLSRYLGFGAERVNDILGPRLADQAIEHSLETLIKSDYTVVLPLSNTQRRTALDLLVKFFADHIETLGDLKSLQILKEVLS